MTEKYAISAPGIAVTLCALGASAASVRVWGREVSLSPLNFDTGEADPSLAGRTVGPCCGRVRRGEIDIDGQKLKLACNEGENHLHGGPHGASFQVWRVEAASPEALRFALDLPDGLDGYPGNRRLTVEYRAEPNALRAVFSATSDRPTWMGMTSHLYWDLTGRFDGSAMRQLLEIAADKQVICDENHLPVAVTGVGEAFDFTIPAAPADRMRAHPDDPQLRIGRGYNAVYLLDGSRPFAARLTAPDGLRMTLTTDQAALAFYSGGFLGPEIRLAGGPAVPGCALALEAEPVPDPFHLLGQRPELLRPGEVWRREVRWAFDRAEEE